MQKAPDDIDVLLPFGEALRGFLEQPFIAPADLRHTLRSRGVFLSRSEKRDTIPTLVCLLLCPREFDELRECQSSREDNPKQITRTLPSGMFRCREKMSCIMCGACVAWCTVRLCSAAL